jgi:two-component system, OmpR family, sensor histidine kinase BaeS
MSRRRPRLAVRLMTAMALVIGIGGITLLVTVNLVAPGLFHDHLSHFGMMSPDVTAHAEEAFASSFAIAITVAMAVSLITAGLVSWFLVRRVARPVEDLAAAAETVATGTYTVEVPAEPFSSELEALSTSFSHMADRLAATDASRTRLLADLAHELRTPMATLEAYIDGLEDGVVEPTAESYETMRGQVARLRRLATDLRESAAADEHALHLNLVPLDAGAAAMDAVAAATPRYRAKGVELTFEPVPGALPVAADPERLGQVLSNLLDNALRHTPPGGHVHVAAAPVGATAVLSVTDDGDGIPVDQLHAVFDRFHRVDPARASSDGSGSGLGLTIARAIVTDHGGTLTAASDGPGTGACFTVTLARAT